MPWSQDPEHPLVFRRRLIARKLRLRLTEPEKRLWWHLRHRMPLSGTHWRRQVALASYVVDFCCLEHRLIVEVDGNQHGLGDHHRRDEDRTRVLATQGFRVLRFTNGEVMTALDTVLDTILAACNPTPSTPNLSPQGEGERIEDGGP